MTLGADVDARRRFFTRAARPGFEAPLHAARFEGRWALLDVARGEYLTVPDLGEASRLDLPESSPDSLVALKRALARAGVAERNIALVAVPPDLLENEQPRSPSLKRATAGDVTRLALALAVTAWDLRRPFAVLVRPRLLRGRSRGDDEAARQAALFSRLVVWSPWQGECLFRSRWLLRYLQLQGCAADWVFGVRGWPFQAHCWVRRQDGVLLNEQPGAVLAYREIAVF